MGDSTPEKPVHCVVWAKELHKLLFGDPKTSMMYEENPEDSVYMKEVSVCE
jgi:ubiquitin-like 1-activating enzyme E1 B